MPRRPGEAYLKNAKQKAARAYNAARPKTQNFYHTKRWKHLRDYFISKSPLCVECARRGVVTAGELVDHIIPITEGGATMDVDNLQVLWAPCHNRKHGGEGEVKSLEGLPRSTARSLA